MPTPDEELDQMLAGGVAQPVQQAASGQQTKSPDDELDELLSAGADAPKSHVIDMPTQTIEYTPPAPAPWYKRFLPNPTAALHGAAAGATMNWGEEGAGKLSAGLSSVLPGLSDPEGYERNYAAGSQSADMTAGLEAENKQLRKDNPASFIGGEIAGSLPAAIGLGGAVGNVVRPVMGAAASASPAAMAVGENMAAGALQGAAAGSGADTDNRLRGAGRGAVAGAATAGGLQALGTGLQAAGRNADNVANRLLTQTFMTPAQRANYTLQKGPDELPQLGKDARDAGLFGGPLRRWLPTRARGVADRAVDVMQGSTGKIQKFEQELADQGVNPDVSVKPIADRLRADASEFDVPVVGAERDVSALTKQADLLEQPEAATVAGKMERPPALPEWVRNKPARPQYGAAVEPVQEPLPGTELPEVPATNPRPLPPAPEQLAFPTPRAMPEQQLNLDLSSTPARSTPVQMQMDLPRQQMSQQLGLGLEPMQAPLRLPPAEAVKRTRPEMTFDRLPVKLPSGGTPQEPMFLGTEPARPPAMQAAASDAQQLGLQLPDRQIPLPLDPPRPLPFRPEARPASQLNLPIQERLPLPPVPAPVPSPAAPPPSPVNPLAGKQEVLNPELINVNRGPQPELSAPLPDATAQIARENIPLTDAMRMKRYLGKKIDWAQKPNAEHSGLGENAAQKLAWKGISDQIDSALKGDVRVDPTKLGEYNSARKNFHTAATAFDPALKMAEREGEIGLGARDFMAAQAFGGGPAGGLASMANKQLAGTLPSTASNAIRAAGAGSKLAGVLSRGAAKGSPVTAARAALPEGTPENKVREEANNKVKNELRSLLKKTP